MRQKSLWIAFAVFVSFTLLASDAGAAAIFVIEDGDPDVSMSEWIWSKNSLDVPIGWNESADLPPGEFENPVSPHDDNWVWVKVSQTFAVLTDQNAFLHLFIGQTGVDHLSSEIGNPANQFIPTDGWTPAQWEAELAQGKVVRIPFSSGQPAVEISHVDHRPGPGFSKWYLFRLENALVPPNSASSGRTYSLLACIDDNKDVGTDFSVEGDDSFAERQLDVLGIDFSDAPDPTYPTLTANDGARHIATGPMLGTLRDTEREGQPTAAADGDDGNDTDDDDGVVFTSLLVPSTTATLDVTASESSLLNAWIDFNEDGDWLDADEQVFTDHVLAVGVNNLSIDVPATAASDVTPFARFRLDSVGGLSPTGLAGDGEVEDYEITRDIDECYLGTDNCHANAVCANKVGSFTCTCIDGYDGDGVTCTDIDECERQIDNCSVNATCTNTPGSFTCGCDVGYSGDGVTGCNDVNECLGEGGGNDCSSVASCINTPGTFVCVCDTGFVGDGVVCTDIDECATLADNCATNATCTNTSGSFTCACINGFAGDGVTCTDMDECATETDNCDTNATCTNTVGSFTCECLTGYAGDGVTCTDIDECTVGTDNCDVDATCLNTSGGFTCECDAGFTGDGVTCIDIDECTTETDNCDANATCINTAGSFACACKSDFTGDGVSCTAASGGSPDSGGCSSVGADDSASKGLLALLLFALPMWRRRRSSQSNRRGIRPSSAVRRAPKL